VVILQEHAALLLEHRLDRPGEHSKHARQQDPHPHLGLLDVAAMGQSVTATIDVMEDKVRLKVLLPPMLGMFSGLIQGALQKKGNVLLEDHHKG
jgi:hypothetical protein